MSLKVKRRKRGEQDKERQRELKRTGRVRSVCLRAAMRHMGWLLVKDKTEGDDKGERCEMPEAGRVLTLFCGFCH